MCSQGLLAKTVFGPLEIGGAQRMADADSSFKEVGLSTTSCHMLSGSRNSNVAAACDLARHDAAGGEAVTGTAFGICDKDVAKPRKGGASKTSH